MSGVKSKWRIVNLTNAAAVPPLSIWTPLLFSQASDLQDPNLARIMTRPVSVLVRLIMAFMARCQISMRKEFMQNICMNSVVQV